MAVILNLNRLNPPIKRYSQNLTICYIQTHFTCKGTQRFKTKGWRKICQANGEQKKAGVAILISDKIDFKVTKIKRDKEGPYIMVKRSIKKKKR